MRGHSLLLFLLVFAAGKASAESQIYYLMDKSSSMNFTLAGKSRWAHAVDRVEENLRAKLPSDDQSVKVILFDGAIYSEYSITVKPDEVDDVLDKLAHTKPGGTTVIGARLKEVIDEITATNPSYFEIHLFSDMEESSSAPEPRWEKSATALETLLKNVDGDPRGVVKQYTWAGVRGIPGVDEVPISETNYTGSVRLLHDGIKIDLVALDSGGYALAAPVVLAFDANISTALLEKGFNPAISADFVSPDGQRFPTLLDGSRILAGIASSGNKNGRVDFPNVSLTSPPDSPLRNLNPSLLSRPDWKLEASVSLADGKGDKPILSTPQSDAASVRFLLPSEDPVLVAPQFPLGRIITIPSFPCDEAHQLRIELGWNRSAMGKQVSWVLEPALVGAELFQENTKVETTFSLSGNSQSGSFILTLPSSSDGYKGRLTMKVVGAKEQLNLPFDIGACLKPTWAREPEDTISKLTASWEGTQRLASLVIESNEAAEGREVSWSFVSQENITIRLAQEVGLGPERVLNPSDTFLLTGKRQLLYVDVTGGRDFSGKLRFLDKSGALPLLEVPITGTLTREVIGIVANLDTISAHECVPIEVPSAIALNPNPGKGRIRVKAARAKGVEWTITAPEGVVHESDGSFIIDVDRPVRLGIKAIATSSETSDLEVILSSVEDSILLLSEKGNEPKSSESLFIPLKVSSGGISAKLVDPTIKTEENEIGTLTEPILFHRSLKKLEDNTLQGIIGSDEIKVVEINDVPPALRTLPIEARVRKVSGDLFVNDIKVVLQSENEGAVSVDDFLDNAGLEFILPAPPPLSWSEWFFDGYRESIFAVDVFIVPPIVDIGAQGCGQKVLVTYHLKVRY